VRRRLAAGGIRWPSSPEVCSRSPPRFWSRAARSSPASWRSGSGRFSCSGRHGCRGTDGVVGAWSRRQAAGSGAARPLSPSADARWDVALSSPLRGPQAGLLRASRRRQLARWHWPHGVRARARRAQLGDPEPLGPRRGASSLPHPQRSHAAARAASPGPPAGPRRSQGPSERAHARPQLPRPRTWGRWCFCLPPRRTGGTETMQRRAGAALPPAVGRRGRLGPPPRPKLGRQPRGLGPRPPRGNNPPTSHASAEAVTGGRRLRADCVARVPAVKPKPADS
jgi:hypothetical protein